MSEASISTVLALFDPDYPDYKTLHQPTDSEISPLPTDSLPSVIETPWPTLFLSPLSPWQQTIVTGKLSPLSPTARYSPYSTHHDKPCLHDNTTITYSTSTPVKSKHVQPLPKLRVNNGAFQPSSTDVRHEQPQPLRLAPLPLHPLLLSIPTRTSHFLTPKLTALTTPAPTLPLTTPAPTLPLTTPAPTLPLTTPAPTLPLTTTAPTLPLTTPAPTLPLTTPTPTIPGLTTPALTLPLTQQRDRNLNSALKPKRKYQLLTTEQLHTLRETFEQDSYHLTKQRTKGLSEETGLSDKAIKQWFSRQRVTDRNRARIPKRQYQKLTKEQTDKLRESFKQDPLHLTKQRRKGLSEETGVSDRAIEYWFFCQRDLNRNRALIPKRQYRFFTTEQTDKLHESFEQDPLHLTKQRRIGLSEETGLSRKAVTNWFINQRTKMEKLI